jgi:uncharacterized protein (DUF1778 family)
MANSEIVQELTPERLLWHGDRRLQQAQVPQGPVTTELHNHLGMDAEHIFHRQELRLHVPYGHSCALRHDLPVSLRELAERLAVGLDHGPRSLLHPPGVAGPQGPDHEVDPIGRHLKLSVRRSISAKFRITRCHYVTCQPRVAFCPITHHPADIGTQDGRAVDTFRKSSSHKDLHWKRPPRLGRVLTCTDNCRTFCHLFSVESSMATKAQAKSKKAAARPRKRDSSRGANRPSVPEGQKDRNEPTTTREARQPKASRFEARLTEDVKVLFQQAAELRGETLTDFVLSASREKAVETLQEAQLVRLTAEDQKRFAEALLNPWEPSQRLRDAAERYRQMTG